MNQKVNDKRYQTYAGWLRALRKVHKDVLIEGNKDIAQAYVNGGDGKVLYVGQWDGATGTVGAGPVPSFRI